MKEQKTRNQECGEAVIINQKTRKHSAEDQETGASGDGCQSPCSK